MGLEHRQLDALLRMLFSGLFDRYPQLTILLGHMGETLPYFAWRIDGRYANTEQAQQGKIRRKPSEYFRSNLIITTTGVCQDSAFSARSTSWATIGSSSRPTIRTRIPKRRPSGSTARRLPTSNARKSATATRSVCSNSTGFARSLKRGSGLRPSRASGCQPKSQAGVGAVAREGAHDGLVCGALLLR